MKKKIMVRTIDKPYHTNHAVYIIIITVSFLALYAERCVISLRFLKIIDNISFGCIASTLVAWFVDCANVRMENQKSKIIFDNVYSKLKFALIDYIETWSRICSAAFRENDLYNSLNDWSEWYALTKRCFASSSPERKQSLITFFKSQLEDSIRGVNEAIFQITDNYFLLSMNGAINDKLKSIIENYKFEFSDIDLDLQLKDGIDIFWKFFDAINDDVYNYIGDWEDIRYINYIRHCPHRYLLYDENEVLRAMLKADEDAHRRN